jgi:tRNA-dihydrouridine synthase
VKVAADAGVAWVAIHGRTRAQGYSGEADWDFIGEIKAKSPLPIIGNGDISTGEDAVRRYKTYGVDAVLIGRGALRNPFLFEQAEKVLKGEEPGKPTIEDYLKIMREQRELLEATYPARMAMIHARKFLAWYSAGFPGCHEYRKKLFSITEPEVIWAETFEFFTRNTSNRDLEFMSQPFLMGGHG